MVLKDEFLDLKAETGSLIQKVNEITMLKEKNAPIR